MVVLVTGFEPNDDEINTSEVVVKSLAENLPLELIECRELLRFEVMPGNTNLLEDALKQAFQVHAPDFCLFTGQAPGRNKITIERMAAP
jgi:pyroglutamyl-peptidase